MALLISWGFARGGMGSVSNALAGAFKNMMVKSNQCRGQADTGKNGRSVGVF